jgi:hypothetical protein
LCLETILSAFVRLSNLRRVEYEDEQMDVNRRDDDRRFVNRLHRPQ